MTLSGVGSEGENLVEGLMEERDSLTRATRQLPDESDSSVPRVECPGHRIGSGYWHGDRVSAGAGGQLVED